MIGFEGFTEERIACGDVTLFVRHNAAPERPALILLHGYPQTSAMWHQIVADFAGRYHVIVPDLRGYGRSDKPTSTPDHATYSKRAMGNDVIALMDHFGHALADVGSHDRGARVAHRMSMDHPDRVRRLVILDIAPTREMYANTTDAFARAYWHWFFLIQPAPMPEDLILGDASGFWRHKCVNLAKGEALFHPEAEAEYVACFDNRDAVHASCEDYRAAATIDIAHDDADGHARLVMPVLVLWGRKGTIEACFDPLALWRLRAEDVSGEALDCAHYMAEEVPEAVSLRMSAFFAD